MFAWDYNEIFGLHCGPCRVENIAISILQQSTKLISNRGWGRASFLKVEISPRVVLAVALCCAGSADIMISGAAIAQQAQALPVDDWIISVGGGAQDGPSFAGSKRHSVSPIASFDFRRIDDPVEFSAADDNFDYTILDIAGLELGPVVGTRGGRSSTDDSRLGGLHDVKWNLDGGVFLQYWPIENRLRLRSETRQALWGKDGIVEDLSADWVQPVSENLVLSAGPRSSFANSVYMRNNFGVSAGEAASTDRFKSYDAHAGLKAVGLAVAADYTFSPAWGAQAYARYDRLMGAAANSPITADIGTRNQTIIGITFSHSFQVSF